MGAGAGRLPGAAAAAAVAAADDVVEAAAAAAAGSAAAAAAAAAAVRLAAAFAWKMPPGGGGVGSEREDKGEARAAARTRGTQKRERWEGLWLVSAKDERRRLSSATAETG